MRWVMRSKLHNAIVTEANLAYVGSITIDADLMRAADLLEGEKVDVVDVTNGNRLSTYAITGDAGSGIIGINGAAAHLVKPDDLVIIIGYGQVEDAEARDFKGAVVFVDAANRQVSIGDDAGFAPAGSGLKSARAAS